MKPDKNIIAPWELHGYFDVDYAGDNDTWKFLTRYIVLINGAVIAWSSQSHKTVKIYITAAEY